MSMVVWCFALAGLDWSIVDEAWLITCQGIASSMGVKNLLGSLPESEGHKWYESKHGPQNWWERAHRAPASFGLPHLHLLLVLKMSTLMSLHEDQASSFVNFASVDYVKVHNYPRSNVYPSLPRIMPKDTYPPSFEISRCQCVCGWNGGHRFAGTKPIHLLCSKAGF